MRQFMQLILALGMQFNFYFYFAYFTNYNMLLTSMNTKKYSIYHKKRAKIQLNSKIQLKSHIKGQKGGWE
jgi:hypothetical protein